jgi:hypothetical protein
MRFDRLVFWSGVWNIGLGLILITPSITQLFRMQIPNPFWPWIVAGFLWYTAVALILSSRDVRSFASIVYWEALLRLFRSGGLDCLWIHICWRFAGSAIRNHRLHLGSCVYCRIAARYWTLSFVDAPESQ